MSNTIYVPSFPGSSGATGILPGFKQGGFGSGGGGGASYNPPPTGWIRPDGYLDIGNNHPLSTGWVITGNNDNSLIPDVGQRSTPAVQNGHTPRNIPGLEGCVSIDVRRSNYPIWQGARYHGWANAGYTFDQANGFRVMGCFSAGYDFDVIFYIEESTQGYTLAWPSWTAGPTISSRYWDRGGTYGPNDSCTLSHRNSDEANADAQSSVNIKIRGGGWVYLGIEFPAGGVGNIVGRATVYGRSGYTWPWTATLPCPTFGGAVWDAVNYRIFPSWNNSYSNTIGVWYGTLADDWPV